VSGERPTVAWIDPEALAANFGEARRLAAGREVIAVVKADGYGHGARTVARGLLEAGCRELAVATVDEARELRGAGIQTSLLVLGGIHDAAEAETAAAHGLTVAVHHMGQLPWLRAAAPVGRAPLALQLEVDTGMARMGVPAEQVAELARAIEEAPELELDGIYTHLSRADEEDPAPSVEQLVRFAGVLDALPDGGRSLRRVHVANSAGLLATPELESVLPAAVNAVRPGLMLYGVAPAPHQKARAELTPVMTLETAIVNLRDVAAGRAVGYGGSWVAKCEGRIATLPIGYADGVPWSLANTGVALVNGIERPFAGRVSMDLVTLDVGSAPAKIGDRVVLFGEPALPVEAVAELAGTLAYELLVRVGTRVPRKVRVRTDS
jgi:alanine racemase